EHPFDELRFDPGSSGSQLEIDSITLRQFEGVKRNAFLLGQITNLVKVAPKEADFRFLRGDLYLRLGQPEKAAADFKVARQLNAKKTLNRHLKYVSEYEAEKNWPLVIAHLVPVIEEEEKNTGKAALLFKRGDLLASLGRWKEAVSDYQRGLD